jgi:hypothetical protein
LEFSALTRFYIDWSFAAPPTFLPGSLRLSVHISLRTESISSKRRIKNMSRITDSIYYTLISDGCSSEQAAQSARSFYDPFHVDRFDSYPLVSSREERRIMRRSSEAAVKGNPGHPGCFAMYSFR